MTPRSSLALPVSAAAIGMALAVALFLKLNGPRAYEVRVTGPEPGAEFAAVSNLDLPDGDGVYTTPHTFEVTSPDDLRLVVVPVNPTDQVQVTAGMAWGMGTCMAAREGAHVASLELGRFSCRSSAHGFGTRPLADGAYEEVLQEFLGRRNISVEAVEFGGRPACTDSEALELFRSGDVAGARDACGDQSTPAP